MSQLTPTPTDTPTNPSHMGAQTVRIEAEALQNLAGSLSTTLKTPFDEAVATLVNTRGRVIITGMGKSGHIGNKLAATFSSTGTPSFFVHPAEASHGDLGMISPKDTVLAMSNSGETAELSDVLGYVKRHQIPLVAMTSNPESTLAKHATVTLVLPKQKEACPHGLAPTTSSTMMLALGDALAMAILDHRAFTPNDFSSFHPGGKLGQRLLTVDTLMHTETDLPCVTEDTAVSDVILEMTSKGFGCAAVVAQSDQTLLGIITDGDLRRHMNNDIMTKTAGDIYTPNPATMHTDALAVDALALMNEKKITSIFITNEPGTVIGLLHMHDCLRAGLS